MRRLAALVLFASTVLASTLQAQQPAYATDPRFQKEITAAKQLRQRDDDRLNHWKKANKIAGGACAECLGRLLELEYRTGDTKAALTSAVAFEQLAARPQDKATAALMRGSIFFHANREKPKPDQLAQADSAFKAALAYDPHLQMAAYMDGRTLALLNRDEEASKFFAACVAGTPATDRYRTRAQHFAENVALARAKMAPPFTVTTADGKQFTLDDMGGRVVLVDFWATWCGPCNTELPNVRRLAQEFAGQPFVLISVSWDNDEQQWQKFIAKQGMSWNQYRDADHQLSTAYDVHSIPHYFTIDSDGVLQSETIGSGSDIEGKIKKLVARAKSAPITPLSSREPTLIASDPGN